MLDQFLSDVMDDFRGANTWFTKGIYVNRYRQDVIDELNDISDRVRALKEKLEQQNFTGSFRYKQEAQGALNETSL